MTGSAGRRLFDALEGCLVPLGLRHPGIGLAAAGAAGRARNALSRRWPAPGELRRLLPGTGRLAAARLASGIAAAEARTRLVLALARRAGLEPLRSLVRLAPGDGAVPAPPAVLGTFHLGAWEALGPALERLGAPVLVLRHHPLYEPREPVEVALTGGGTQERAEAFARALGHLAAGGFVVLAIDADAGEGLAVPCLGGRLELPRGAFALARLTGAPLHPLLARWRGLGVEVAIEPPLATPPGAARDERALALAAAAWLEATIRRRPGDLGLGLLRLLLAGNGVTRPPHPR